VSEEPALNLFAQQAANRRRTTWLVIAFVALFAWLGFGGDWIFAQQTAAGPPDAYHHTIPWIGLVLTAVGLGMAASAWRSGPQRVLWATGAREVLAPATEEERRLVNVVEEMAIASALPKPRIWIIPDDDPNALATGIDPAKAHVAVTQGLLQVLTRDELQGVVAHEMAHIKNLDVRLMTTLAALVGAIALVSDGVRRWMWYGGGRGRRSSGGGRKGNAGPLVAVLLVVWIVSWLLAPLIAQLLAFGVSRKREYLADASGAQFTRNPLALASALQKIEHAAHPTKAITRGAAHLCIADPAGRRLAARDGILADVFTTHPPMAKRLARLKGMGYAQLKREQGMEGVAGG
jgi:heat shock protein HtpX